MTTDSLERLAALAPQPQWDDNDRADLLTYVLAAPATAAVTARTPIRRRRRVLVITGIIGLAAAVAVAVPALAPSSTPVGATPAAAAALDRLAVVAARYPAGAVGPGKFWHQVYVEKQNGFTGCCTPAGKDLIGTTVTHHESWTDSVGNIWRVDRIRTAFKGAQPKTENRVAEFTVNKYDDTAYYASLPTDPSRLRDRLRADAKSDGAPSIDRAVFITIQQIFQRGTAPRDLRTAMLKVLAETPHVSVQLHASDPAGRTAERFDYIDQHSSPDYVDSMFFDPATAQYVGEQSVSSDPSHGRTTYSNTVEISDIVDTIPASVLRQAKVGK